jgi:hypothetical protein
VIKLFLNAHNRPVTKKPLLPHQHKPFNSAVDRLCAAFIDNPTIDTLYDILSFPRLGLTAALELKGSDYAKHLATFPNVTLPPLRPRSAPGIVSPADRAERETKNGYLGKATRSLLPSNGLANLANRSVRDQLRDFLVLCAKMAAQGRAPGRELMMACRADCCGRTDLEHDR